MIRTAAGALAGTFLVLVAFAVLVWAQPVHARECTPMVASYYGAESGNRTASGSYFDGSQMVAAHRSWKFNTKLRVSYKGKSVVVVVRDRGPYIRGRALDLSTAAARRLGMIRAGVATVCVERL